MGARWPNEELRKIAETDDFHISPFREDGKTYGTPTWIWSVVVDGELYVRSYNGQSGRRYQAALKKKSGRITAAGMTKEVDFEPVSGSINDSIDDAYRSKYASSPYLNPMISARAPCDRQGHAAPWGVTKESSMKMQRVIVRAFGGPDQLTVETLTEPLLPGPGQLLIDVEAAGVNYLDVYQRTGLSPVSLPFAPGYEGVGRVREVGDGVARKNLPVGDRVAWINSRVSYASQVLVPAAEAIPVPRAFSVPEALLFQAVTAEYLINEYRGIGPPNRVLVHAAGVVRQLLVQWCKHQLPVGGTRPRTFGSKLTIHVSLPA